MISKAVKIAAVAGVAMLAFVSQADASQQLTVTRNGMQRLPLSEAAGSVIVANPNIADVNVVDSHTVYVIGRGYGSSAVTILNRAGRPIFDGQIMVTAGQQNAVTMYKGSKASVMVCSNVCQPVQEDGGASEGNSAPSAPMASADATAAAPAGLSAVAPAIGH